MQGMDSRHCLICQSPVDPGELGFWGEVICGDCEALIMELAVDQPEYDEIVKAFRLLWQNQFLALQNHHTMESDNY
ncbi:MAG: hypothetical protein GX956_05980 [Firmicutes bacterium]|nr:hypothetical protein [Bacillota bacterium]